MAVALFDHSAIAFLTVIRSAGTLGILPVRRRRALPVWNPLPSNHTAPDPPNRNRNRKLRLELRGDLIRLLLARCALEAISPLRAWGHRALFWRFAMLRIAIVAVGVMFTIGTAVAQPQTGTRPWGVPGHGRPCGSWERCNVGVDKQQKNSDAMKQYYADPTNVPHYGRHKGF